MYIQIATTIMYLMQLSEKRLNTDKKRNIIIVDKKVIYRADKSIIKFQYFIYQLPLQEM